MEDKSDEIGILKNGYIYIAEQQCFIELKRLKSSHFIETSETYL